LVVELGQKALSLSGHPYEPVEQFVFIEGYAHAGEWDRAIDLSSRAYAFSPEPVGAMLCRLWERIETETAPSVESDAANASERSAALVGVRGMLGCNP
jgi:hypothetical protein